MRPVKSSWNHSWIFFDAPRTLGPQSVPMGVRGQHGGALGRQRAADSQFVRRLERTESFLPFIKNSVMSSVVRRALTGSEFVGRSSINTQRDSKPFPHTTLDLKPSQSNSQHDDLKVEAGMQTHFYNAKLYHFSNQWPQWLNKCQSMDISRPYFVI